MSMEDEKTNTAYCPPPKLVINMTNTGELNNTDINTLKNEIDTSFEYIGLDEENTRTYEENTRTDEKNKQTDEEINNIDTSSNVVAIRRNVSWNISLNTTIYYQLPSSCSSSVVSSVESSPVGNKTPRCS